MHRVYSRLAFSFTELLIAVSILSVVLAGMMEMFLLYSSLGETSSKTRLALTEVQNKIEEIKSTPFNSIVTNYSAGGTLGNTFALSSLNGRGVIDIDQSIEHILKVTINASFKVKNDRVVGEDKNLNGTIDVGEDVNSNSVLDSSVNVTTYVSKRS